MTSHRHGPKALNNNRNECQIDQSINQIAENCKALDVLHQLLPPPKHTGYNLRSRGHGLTLSLIPSEFMRKNFINRMLFNDDIY